MRDATLFPISPTPAASRPCTRRSEPEPRLRSGSNSDGLRTEHGRTTLTTSSVLTAAQLAELVRRSRLGPVEVRFRIPTPDRRLAAVLEPGSPPPSLRMASLRAARRAGLVAGVVVQPLVPGVNSHEGDLRRLFAEARHSRASFVSAELVFPSERRRHGLLRALEAQYPRVAARYEVWRKTSNRPPGEERTRLEALLQELGRRFATPAVSATRTREGQPPCAGAQQQFAFAV